MHWTCIIMWALAKPQNRHIVTFTYLQFHFVLFLLSSAHWALTGAANGSVNNRLFTLDVQSFCPINWIFNSLFLYETCSWWFTVTLGGTLVNWLPLWSSLSVFTDQTNPVQPTVTSSDSMRKSAHFCGVSCKLSTNYSPYNVYRIIHIIHIQRDAVGDVFPKMSPLGNIYSV